MVDGNAQGGRRFVKPIDTELITYLARTHEALVTVEENVVAGGAGSAVAEVLAATDGTDGPNEDRKLRGSTDNRLPTRAAPIGAACTKVARS